MGGGESGRGSLGVGGRVKGGGGEGRRVPTVGKIREATGAWNVPQQMVAIVTFSLIKEVSLSLSLSLSLSPFLHIPLSRQQQMFLFIPSH